MIRIIEGLIILFGILLIVSFLAYFFNCSYYCIPEISPQCRSIIGVVRYSMLMLFFLFIVYFICLNFSKNSKSS